MLATREDHAANPLTQLITTTRTFRFLHFDFCRGLSRNKGYLFPHNAMSNIWQKEMFPRICYFCLSHRGSRVHPGMLHTKWAGVVSGHKGLGPRALGSHRVAVLVGLTQWSQYGLVGGDNHRNCLLFFFWERYEGRDPMRKAFVSSWDSSSIV